MKRHPFLMGFVIVAVILAMFYGLGLLTVSLFANNKPSKLLMTKKSIGVIEIVGVLFDSKNIVEDLIEFADDNSIKAVVIRIDSPGGAVAPSQEILSEILTTRQVKPVVASLGSVAASGGYYVACGADLIIANEGTLTGSIGVIMEFINIEGLYKWIGLKSNVIKAGKYKDIGNPNRKMKQEEMDLLQDMVDDVHDQFITAVSESRSIDKEELSTIADGRVFSGRKAKELGLVDELGGFRQAVKAAAQMADIEGEPELIYPKKRRRSYFDLFFTEMFDALQRVLINSADQGGLQYRYEN